MSGQAAGLVDVRLRDTDQIGDGVVIGIPGSSPGCCGSEHRGVRHRVERGTWADGQREFERVEDSQGDSQGHGVGPGLERPDGGRAHTGQVSELGLGEVEDQPPVGDQSADLRLVVLVTASRTSA